jgi:hypothetical protein
MKSRSVALLAFLLTFGAFAQDRRMVQAEYFVDVDPGIGLATAMTAADNTFDQALEQVLATAQSFSPPGSHLVGVRVKGFDGVWSNTFRTVFYQNEISPARSIRVQHAEYYVDSDPGTGNASPLLAFDGDFDQAFEEAFVSGVPMAPGSHVIGVRLLDSEGNWSNTFRTTLFQDGVSPARGINLQEAEYFVDADPGPGNASPLLAFDGALDQALEEVVGTDGTLQFGYHTLGVRLLGGDGNWSNTFRISVFQAGSNDARSLNIQQAEYFVGADPGPGGGTALLAEDGDLDQALEYVHGSLVAQSAGLVSVGVRYLGQDGAWSNTFRTVISVEGDSDGDGISDANDTCPTVTGQIGSPCDDGDPDTNLSQLNATCACEAVPQSGDYRSVASGAWETASTWEIYSGVSFQPASSAPSVSSGWITIRTGHTVTISSTVAADQTLVQTGGALSLSSTLSLNDAAGDDLRIRGTLTLLGGALDGTGSVVIRNGALLSVPNVGTLRANSTLNVEAGGSLVKSGTATLFIGGIINNAGTFDMNGGILSGLSGAPRTFNNLSGGVINLNVWRLQSNSWSQTSVYNAGTINKNSGNFVQFSFAGDRWRNLDGGVVNVNSGYLAISTLGLTPELSDQRGAFNVAPGATLQVGGNFGFRFLGTSINNNGILNCFPTAFLGTGPQFLNGTGSLNYLTINSPGGVTLGGIQTVTSNLTLTSGTITLGNNDLILGTSSLDGGSASSYVVTNGTGSLLRTVAPGSAPPFPVGTAGSYLPAVVQLDPASTTDVFRVRAADGVSTTYDANDNPTGSVVTSNSVLRTWVVREGTDGGSNATLRLQWNGADEGTGFTGASCRVSRNTGSAWDAAADGPSGGADPFTRERNSITAFGPFTVNSGLVDLCPGGPEPGTACDDGSTCTINDVIGSNCQCAGTVVDTDGDGTCDAEDGCPADPLKISAGTCGCGTADTDTDNDGTANCIDGCPNDPLKIAAGTCGCGVVDSDTDNDGTADCIDGCPNDPLKIAAGACGCGSADTDADNDGTADCIDGCPNDPLKIAAGTCGCGTADTDTDNDGTANCIDGCPNDPLKIAAGTCGCGTADTDMDNDGTADCIDGCPNDPLKIVAGTCGCGIADTDTDNDGTANCVDSCPNDPLKIAPGTCGCGVADSDTDNDGTADCIDGCPNDPLKVVAGICGCGTPDTDSDGDGTADCNDACPNDPLKTLPGGCGCGVTDVPAQWYADNDADGFGDGANSIPGLACLQPSGYVGNSIDCDDNNAAINPMAYDACPDGIDNNCNGLVDEQSGMIGQPCSSTIGACQPGVWGCVANVLTCVGGTLPSAEICSDGIDNDCDGQVDEDSPETVPLTWYVDADGDGFGDPDPLLVVLSCDAQPGYALNGNDCNDANAAIHPGALEVCNDLDDDCDGIVDEGTLVTWYFDEDGDGFGDDAVTLTSCAQPNGYVAVGGDCDDLIPTTYPGAPEVCNGVDDDCDGAVDGDDANAVLAVWYLDNDGDGYGITGITTTACDPPFGYASQPGDCNDNNDAVHPNAPDVCADGVDNNCNGGIDEGSALLGQPCSGAPCSPATWECVGGVLTCVTGTGPAVELCGDGIDNDCDGAIDEEDPTSVPQTYYVDADGDGYGDASQSTQSCFPVQGLVTIAGDCNDADPTINPSALEICDGIDNNCDGAVDIGTGQTWYLDADGDGFAGGAISIVACAPPVGYTALLGDCNDSDASINPLAYDACPDGIDNNCNGQIDEQSAMIGQPCGSAVGQCVLGIWGCVNNVLTCIGGVPPSAEICGDGLDNDCDGQVDEDSPETVPLTWYVDADGDGFGDPDPLLVLLSCAVQPDHALNGNDCNDNDPTINPTATEICDGLDNDCDGTVDEGLADFYADGDGDGLGDPAQPVPCSTPGAVANSSDCDDNDPTPCDVVVIEGLVERRVVGNAGGATQIGGVHVEWTVGEALVSMIEGNGLRLTQGFHQSPTYRLRLNLRTLLQGPYVSPAVWMTDGLRSGGWIPFTEPYTAAGYAHVEGGNETTTPGVLAIVGPDAIVDWIVVELRDPAAPDLVISTRTGLLQRDGDIVEVDGYSPLAFKARAANYRVAVLHRNHLPVITAAPVLLSPVPVDVDLTDGSTPLYGVEPTRTEGAVQLLWSGDVNADGSILYTGAFNDRDPILLRIGGIIPTNTINGYLPEDVNMDGTVKYTGTNNDRDPILFNIGGTIPTTVRNAQMP